MCLSNCVAVWTAMDININLVKDGTLVTAVKSANVTNAVVWESLNVKRKMNVTEALFAFKTTVEIIIVKGQGSVTAPSMETLSTEALTT